MQQLTGEPPGRITPLEELVNAPEFEAVAQRKLDSLTFALIAGGDRKAFDRITFRPRMMVNTTKLDLTTTLFGQRMFTPLLVAPMSQQKRFHSEGELATARGCAAAKAVMVIADRADYPLDQIVAQANGTVWYQVTPDADIEGVRTRAHNAVAAGCKAVCLAVRGWDWSAIDQFRKGLNVPVLLKGIMSPEEARAVVGRGIQGIVVSNYTKGAPSSAGLVAAMEVLPGIADAVAGKIPILIDGSFRRGGDALMALALGASAVIVGRPVLWGLAAYGAPGVQRVVELMQTELARDMAMCGKVNPQALDRTVVRVHKW